MRRLWLFLVAGWLLIAAVTLSALLSQGLVSGIETFLSDLRHPWRAQFYADLELQLLIFAAWVVWREASLTRGLAFAAATMLLGALFTLAYLLAASVKAKGDVRALLLGSRAHEVS